MTEVPREQIKAPLTFIESAQDRRHRYFYNQANELIGEQLPTRQVIATHRNAQGELLEKISTLGALPELTHWDSALIEKLIAETAQKKETFELDARGQCVAYTDAEKIKTTQRFDAAGRKISSTTGDKTNTVTFDALNRVIKESHRSGLEINTRYAPCGQVESETRTDTLGAASPKEIV